MKYLPALAAVCLLIVPSVASAQQLPGDPNPHGTTVTVTDYNHNWLKPYSNSGTIQINSGAHLENKAAFNAHATLTNESTGTINNDGKYSDDLVSFEAAVMENYGTFNNNSGGNLVSHGTFLNEGGSTLNNSGTLYSRYLRNNGTLNNSGSWTNPWNGTTTTNYGTLTNDAGGTWKSNGTLTNNDDGTLINNGTLTNNGMLNNTGTITFLAGSTFDNTKGTLTNNGTIASYIDDYFQILESGANGKVVFDKGSNFVNHAKINIASGNTLTNEQTLTNATEGELTNIGTLINNGTLNNNAGGTLTNHSGGTLTNNYGTLNNDSGATLANYGTLFNNYDGTLTNSAGATMSNNGTLINGTLTTSGTLTNYGTLTNWEVLSNNGTIDTTNGTFNNNGVIAGTGHIKGNVSGSGYVAPGQSAGGMTIDGHLIHYGGGHEIELGGLFDGGSDQSLTEFDWIDVTGNVELAGLLNVSLIDGFKLHRGNWFDILRVGGTLSGQYDELGEGALVGNFGGQDLFITYGGMGDGGGVALFTNAVPEPTTVLIWSMLAGLGMTVRRRR